MKRTRAPIEVAGRSRRVVLVPVCRATQTATQSVAYTLRQAASPTDRTWSGPHSPGQRTLLRLASPFRDKAKTALPILAYAELVDRRDTDHKVCSGARRSDLGLTMPRATPEQLAWCYIWHLLELTAEVAASHLSELAISAGYNVFPGCQPNILNMRALILAVSLFSAHLLAHPSSPHSSWQSRSRLQFSSDALPLKQEYEPLDGQVPLELSQR